MTAHEAMSLEGAVTRSASSIRRVGVTNRSDLRYVSLSVNRIGGVVDSKELLESRRYLSEISVWPRPNRLDLSGWVENFDEGRDTEIALALLEAHVHMDEQQIKYAVASTIRDISSRDEFGLASDRPANWDRFIQDVVFSFPLSRSGDSTASGYIFGRVVESLGFNENRIIDSEHLVGHLHKSGPLPVVFLDDLAASGTQFTRNWKRNYPKGSGSVSLEQLASDGQMATVYYSPLVSTQVAKDRIESECGVTVVPTYVLDEDYSVLSEDTRLVPNRLRQYVPDFLAKYAPRTGRDEYGFAGYGDLGLALSFHHSCPNNTVPVLQPGSVAQNWRPWST